MSDRNYRFYHPATLDIVDEVPRSKSKKLADGTESTMRKATIADAKKLGLLESVTSIIKDTFATSSQLIDWINDQTLEAAMLFPFSGQIDNPQSIEDYKTMIAAKAAEFRDFTADRGKFIHTCINRWIETGTSADDPACENSIVFLKKYMDNLSITESSSEKKLGSKEIGFAGTPDIWWMCKDNTRYIVDVKTTSLKSFKKPYDSWKLQLGAYRILTASMPGTKLVQMVVDRDTGQSLFIEYDDPDKWADAFLHLFELRCIVNGYDPRKM